MGYFAVKDYVDRGEVQIYHQPTEDMIGDYFTKPLQGKLFRKYRRVIMGWEPLSTLWSSTTDTETVNSKERVGRNGLQENDKDRTEQNDSTTKSNKRTYADVAKGNQTKAQEAVESM